VASRLEFEQWVPFPLESVFAFFFNPENLPRIMPAASGTRLIAINRLPTPSPGALNVKAAGVGSTIGTSFRVFPVLPIRAQWVARITEFEWNHYFADVQDQGPFKSWHHRHEFRAETRKGISGTVARDVIEYEVGFGFLGAAVNALFIRRRMEGTFAQRQKVLPELLSKESGSQSGDVSS
jgi:ligand-binding SRPBCC domain-containing protein